MEEMDNMEEDSANSDTMDSIWFYLEGISINRMMTYRVV